MPARCPDHLFIFSLYFESALFVSDIAELMNADTDSEDETFVDASEGLAGEGAARTGPDHCREASLVYVPSFLQSIWIPVNGQVFPFTVIIPVQ